MTSSCSRPLGHAGLGLLLDRDRLESEVGRVVEQVHDQDFALKVSPRLREPLLRSLGGRYAPRFFRQARYVRERLSSRLSPVLTTTLTVSFRLGSLPILIAVFSLLCRTV